METILAIVIGVLYAAGLYLIMRRSMVKLVLGLALIGHAANLLIFVTGRVQRGSSAVIPPDQTALIPPYPDPLPQALILTAIVIGFGTQAFTIVLLKRAYKVVKTDDMDLMNTTDR